MVEFQAQADSSGEKGDFPTCLPLLDNSWWEGRQVRAELPVAPQLPLLSTVRRVHLPYLT